MQLHSSLQGHRDTYVGLLLAAVLATLGTTPARAGWGVTWIDPFEGDRVDWSNWTAQTAADYNNEVQCYTDNDDPTTGNHNYEVAGGTLTIIARRQATNCPDAVNGNFNKDWNSGRLNSKDKQEFLYGRLEARIRFLTQPGGTWPAFWMLENRIAEQPRRFDDDFIPWPNPGAGEIDVWEWYSNNPNTYITNFYNASGGCSSSNPILYNYPNGFNDVKEWHDYAIEWDADVARFYIDDTLVRTQNLSNCDQYEEPMFVLLNVAIGGTLGQPVNGMLNEARMEVEYVARCTPTDDNSATRCNESTPVAQNPGNTGGGTTGTDNGSANNNGDRGGGGGSGGYLWLLTLGLLVMSCRKTGLNSRTACRD